MPEPRRVPRITLGLVLAATALTLAVGFLWKSPCLGPWDGRQYTRLCYSDVAALYEINGISRGLIPYIEARNEYPVLTGFTMALAGVPARSYASFFSWNALLLAGLGLVTAYALYRMVGARALYFALAPTLLVYGFVNWDLLAVALATLGTWAFLRRRDGLAGVLLGLGAAAKLYPALLVVPFAIGRLREGRPDRATALAGGAAAAWTAVNLPIAIAAPERWAEFFRFNGSRPADWDSIWFLTQRHFSFPESTVLVNLLSAASFAALAGLLWWLARRRRPHVPAWSLGFPLLVAFLLTGKVYSPQFSLWLLPWFALALPDPRLFAAFSLADVAVFVTRFEFFARTLDLGGVPFEAFEAALLVRAAVLAVCLGAWVRRRAPEPEPEPALEPAGEAVA